MKFRITRFTALVLGAGLAITGAASFDSAAAAELKLKKRTTKSASQTGIGGYTTAFSPNCAAGFALAGSRKQGGMTDWFVCSTPVLSCPKQIVDGKAATVTPQVVLQQVGGNPDGGTVKFRIQYKCDYFHYVPEG